MKSSHKDPNVNDDFAKSIEQTSGKHRKI